MQILAGTGTEPLHMAFSPDGCSLAVGELGAVCLWNLTGRPAPLWSVADAYVGQNFCFAPDGRSLVGGLYDHYRRIDADNGSGSAESGLAEFSPSLFSADGRFGLSVESPYGNRRFRLRC